MAAMKKKTKQLFQIFDKIQPLWWLLVRLWIANVFFSSGLTKFEDFDVTVFLFENEYAVPFVPPYFAALSATFFELACPVALVLGFATRFAVLPLLVMTAVIEFTYQEHVQHAYWAILLAGLLLHGAGKWSVDYLIARKRKR